VAAWPSKRRFRDNKHTMVRPNHVTDSRQNWTASIRATLGTLPDRPLRAADGMCGRPAKASTRCVDL